MNTVRDTKFAMVLGFVEKLPGQINGERYEYLYAPSSLKEAMRDLLLSDAVILGRGWQKDEVGRTVFYMAKRLSMPILDHQTLRPWGERNEKWTGKLIGIWGSAGVGKDTLCRALGWPRAAFADELKADLEYLVCALGLDSEKNKSLLRELWVALGRLGRAVDENYWVNRLLLPPDRACITDVRYWSEVSWIHSKGGLVIELTRPGYGPSNIEEEWLFSDIRKRAKDTGLVLPKIVNDGPPEQMAVLANMFIDAHFGGDVEY